MATGLWTLASLLVVAGASGTDHWATNQRSLSVPIMFKERRTEIKELILYVSSDQGKSWTEQAVAPPDKDSFSFFAATDGMYWMKLCIVSRDGKRSPSDIFKGEPALKILVDTLKPVVRIVSAERQGDMIAVRWEIQEEHPDLKTLRLEYRAADDAAQQWYSVPVDPVAIGSARLRFPGLSAASIRVQLRDTAGNAGQDVHEVPGGANGPALVQASGSTVAPVPSVLPNVALNLNAPSLPPPVPPSVAWEHPSAHPAPAPAVHEPAGPSFPAAATQNFPVQPIPTMSTQTGPRVLATSEAQRTMPMAPAATTGAIHRPRGMLPPKQVVNNTAVSVHYETKHVGPSGIGRVELWVTSDEGHSWRQLACQDNVVQANSVSSLNTELPGEGVFGLRLVVLSRAGRGKIQQPQPNDIPEMMVEVDQTAPVIIIRAPQADPHHPNTLVLGWTVSDANLSPTPITLEWSESRTGPWKPIAGNLANHGRYPWKVPEHMPTNVFLKLTARDNAGNVHNEVYPDPILVDLSEPEGRLTGIMGAPVPR